MRTFLRIVPDRRYIHPSLPVHDVRPLMVFGVASLLSITFILVSPSFDRAEDWPRFFGLLCLLVLVHLVSFCVFSRGGRLILDPFSPQSFYSIFFGTYYLLPFAWLILDSTVSGVLYERMGLAMLLGFLSFQFACRMLSPKRFVAYHLDNDEQAATLLICWAGMVLLAIFYLWRLKNGNFYSHANFYVVGTDTASSLLESFVLQLHFPLVLLLGMAAASPGPQARKARLTLHLLLFVSFPLFVAMSQFRLAATLLPLGWVATHLFRETAVGWHTSLKFAGIALCSMVLIFAIRASIGSGLADSQNQLTDLIEQISVPDLTNPATLADATVGEEDTASRTRAITPLLFFSEVFETLDSPNESFGHGATLWYEAREVMPRLLWKEKPVFLSTQMLIRRRLGMVEIDSSPHPLLQFYYEFGWPGIAIAFFLMGTLMQWLSRNLNTMFMFMLFAFAWSAYVQVEVGIFLNLLITLRAAVLLYVAWKIVLSVLRFRRSPVYGRSTAIATAFPPPRQRAATPFRASRRIIS